MTSPPWLLGAERRAEPAEVPVSDAKTRTEPVDGALALNPLLSALEQVVSHDTRSVSERVVAGGRVASRALDAHQLAAHALAYLATELEAARQLIRWLQRVESRHEAELERRIAGA